MKQNRQSGQIGLVVLLVMAALLSVGIGAVTNSTRDLRITRQDVEAVQAFNAAEQGVERALREIDSGTVSSGDSFDTGEDGNISVTYTITEEQNQFSQTLNEGEVLALEKSAVDDANIQFSFINNCGDSDNPRGDLEITVYKGAADNYEYQRYGYSCDAASTGLSDYASMEAAYFGVDYVLMRVKALGGNVELTIQGDLDQLQPPVYLVDSIATINESDIKKRIQVQRMPPAAPAIFDYLLYSDSAPIIKN